MRRPIAVAAISLCILCFGCEQPPKTPTVRTEKQAEARSNVCQDIAEACARLATQLSDKLPKGAPAAVLPFTDSEGGVRRLGVLAAEGVQHRLADQGLQIVDRQHLNALLTERDLQLTDLVAGQSLDKARQIAGAKTLVVGSTIEGGGTVLLSAKAIDVGTGGVIVATENVALSLKGLDRLMWYVRRPTRPGRQGNLPPLAIRYEFMTPTTGGDMRLADGATVRSGQKFKIRVQPNSDCHLYVLLYDSAGLASVLFPHPQIQMSNEARGGASYEIPEGTKWYWFDNRPGTETFYIVGSYTPLTGLDQILDKMKQAGNQAAQLAGAARQRIDGAVTRGMAAGTSSTYHPKGFRIQHRGVGGVVDLGWGTQRLGDTKDIDDVVVGHATAVKKLTLRHR